MVDEIYDRGYQAGRTELHGGIDRLIDRLVASLSVTFAALHRIEWDAPWNAARNGKTAAN